MRPQAWTLASLNVCVLFGKITTERAGRLRGGQSVARPARLGHGEKVGAPPAPSLRCLASFVGAKGRRQGSRGAQRPGKDTRDGPEPPYRSSGAAPSLNSYCHQNTSLRPLGRIARTQEGGPLLWSRLQQLPMTRGSQPAGREQEDRTRGQGQPQPGFPQLCPPPEPAPASHSPRDAKQ